MPTILLPVLAVFAVPYAAYVVIAHAVAARLGRPWSGDELRRRQAPLLWAMVAAAVLYAAAAAVQGLARLLT
ncbi:hypothetical protein [Kitasatospora cheerisanensis]|uniref:Uncharacterized protein n=1 Tax=Kitasatospora cheerisanensis KCTC 2395 TaxID=1348663 RepID=A0A066YG65_9ACTN|nr:hypothetical protein [Kitasatospora cheerisanensis]KDN80488.1 hypothetical protein KCH_77220 [Kitasatospora cheerisanensis KCTC 2395]